jgi:HTH-type transcriptional regulator / antitoxin HigA
MATDVRVWPDIAIPPGDLLAETLETIGMSQAELARRANRPVQAINEIVRGTKEITPETALQFERVLGVPAHIWTRLEADYRYTKARLEDQARLKGELGRAARYPYAPMAALGWVRKARQSVERVQELLRFFGVASLHQLPAIEAAAFRKSAKLQACPETLAAWLRQGEREAQHGSVAGFGAQRLRAALPELRALTRRPPEEFEPRLRQLLAEAGVVLALVPHLPGTGAHGATRWFGPDRALVQMSLRYRWDDIFWFSLFHELGHVLLHGRGAIFIERQEGNPQDKAERDADRFASDHLISPSAYEVFRRRPDHRTRAAVVEFARQQGIAPSIVVGRLQHDGHLPHSHLNDLRSRFAWAETPSR